MNFRTAEQGVLLCPLEQEAIPSSEIKGVGKVLADTFGYVPEGFAAIGPGEYFISDTIVKEDDRTIIDIYFDELDSN